MKMTGRCTMEYITRYVRDHPGCPKYHAASRNTRFGYAAVDRAIKKGLIQCQLDSRGISHLYINK